MQAVKMYTTAFCPYCVRAKQVLKSKGEIPLSATLGQHVNDKMTSFYVQTPSGFDIEYGWNGLVIDPDTWVPTTSLSVSAWGHKWAHEND